MYSFNLGWGECDIINTLKKDSEYQRVYEQGSSKASSYLVVFWLENDLGYNRYGFSISRKIGKAVKRNQLKRQLKEIIRRWLSPLVDIGYDIVIIARPWINSLNFYEIKKDLQQLLCSCDLIQKN